VSPTPTSISRVCLPHTQLPGTSALFADYLYNFDRVAAFYEHAPDDPAAIRRAAAAAQIPDARRLEVVAALRKQNGDGAALDLLAEPGTIAVVTGQQAGLFSGPAYTVYKALTAIKLARQLTEIGIRAVPVFWVATEDHDFAEIDHVHTFDTAHKPVLLRAKGTHQEGQPAGTVPIESVPLEEFRDSMGDLPYADEVLGLVKDAYRPGRPFGQAFLALMRSLFSGYGLIYLDPLDPAIRKIAAPFLRSAVEQAPEISRAVIARSKELVAAGYHAQVHFEPETSLFFLLEGGKRLALRRRNGDYIQSGRRIPHSELASLAEHLSPNALLRPVLQDYLLPTAAYVGGPAELAYLAQSQVLYRMLLGRQPVAVSRSGFTLLDQRSGSLIERFHLSIPECFQDEASVREMVAARLIPASLDRTFAETAALVNEQSGTLEAQLNAFDPTLGAAMARSRAKMLYQVDKNRRKAAREALVREQRVADGTSQLCRLIYPERHLQERYYSFLPFLAKHGFDLLPTLYENTHRGCPDHLLLTL
jgi:bacillithiol synthase